MLAFLTYTHLPLSPGPREGPLDEPKESKESEDHSLKLSNNLSFLATVVAPMIRFSTVMAVAVLLATACSVSLDMTTRVTDLDNITHDLAYSYPELSATAEDDLGAFDSRYCTKAEEDGNIVVTCSGIPHSLLVQAWAVGEESSLQINATRKDLGGQWEYRVAMANPFMGRNDLNEGDLTWEVNLPGRIVDSNADSVSENDGRAVFKVDLEDPRGTFFAVSVKDKAGEPTLPPRCDNGIAVTNPADNKVLVQDCEALLASVDILAGAALLNWSVQFPISQWDGVVIDGNPARITGLYLYSRELTGEVPDQLGRLTGLETLWLHDNRLSGELPAALGGLSRLEQLSLSRNRLSGGLPASLGRLTNLEFLSLSRNLLTGEIPAELGNLSNLEELWLYDNDLSGEVPPALGNLTSLTRMSISRNLLTGEIPAELGNLSHLVDLQLYDNDLSGEVPPALGNLSHLVDLQLDQNELSGEIPPELGNLSGLNRLEIWENRLTGPIPPALGNLSHLVDLQLDQNELSGEIPPELGNLSGLNRLEIWENRLTGPIPPELGNLTNLTYLSMRGNELTGCVPSALENAYRDIDYPICEAGDPTPPAPPPPPPPAPPVAPTPPLPPAPPAATPTPTPPAATPTPPPTATPAPTPAPPAATPTPPPTATPAPTPTPRPLPDICGDAVSDRLNTGLVGDCNALLAARDTLRGTAALNWSPSTDIAGWDGITLGGSPQRVTKILLQKRELTGSIPVALGRLELLEELWLYINELTGAIPAEMGDLSNLTWLFVSNNNLSGQIPETLNNLTLDRLWLHRNSFTGCVPYNLTLTREYKVDRGLPACAPPSGE